jgi:hypothetical protein
VTRTIDVRIDELVLSGAGRIDRVSLARELARRFARDATIGVLGADAIAGAAAHAIHTEVMRTTGGAPTPVAPAGPDPTASPRPSRAGFERR